MDRASDSGELEDVFYLSNSGEVVREEMTPEGKIMRSMLDFVPNGKFTPAAVMAAARGDFVNFAVAATPGGIEAQEAEGQRSLATAKTVMLPKDVRCPGVGGKAEKIYAAVGIKVIGEHDDLFFDVELPKGWKVVSESHAMWSGLVDEKGRKRAGLFYKAAFYDRKADISFNPRFRATCEPEDGYRSNVGYEERRKMKVFGRAYDGDEIVFSTEGQEPETDYDKKTQQDRDLRVLCENWLVDNGFKNHKDATKYWD